MLTTDSAGGDLRDNNAFRMALFAPDITVSSRADPTLVRLKTPG